MASLNLNKVVLCGRLTADPELKQTPNGVAVTTFNLAVNRRYTKEGEQQQADFISCVAWRNQAEFLCRYFRKGSSVCITGAVQTRSWTDQHNQKRYATEIVADDVMFVDSKSDAQTSTGAEPSAHTPSVPPAIDAIAPPSFEPIKDDDLPF